MSPLVKLLTVLFYRNHFRTSGKKLRSLESRAVALCQVCHSVYWRVSYISYIYIHCGYHLIGKRSEPTLLYSWCIFCDICIRRCMLAPRLPPALHANVRPCLFRLMRSIQLVCLYMYSCTWDGGHHSITYWNIVCSRMPCWTITVLFVGVCVCLSIRLFVRPSIGPSVRLSICLSVCLSVSSFCWLYTH